jgi:hypothetical protein
MLPTHFSLSTDRKWQLTGGIIDITIGKQAHGPLMTAVKRHISIFTSSEWVKSYVEWSQNDGIQRGDKLTRRERQLLLLDHRDQGKRAAWAVAKRLMGLSVYEGWPIACVQYIMHDLLTRDGLVNIEDSAGLIAHTWCGVVNPRVTFQAPRMTWWLSLLFKVVFLFVPSPECVHINHFHSFHVILGLNHACIFPGCRPSPISGHSMSAKTDQASETKC